MNYAYCECLNHVNRTIENKITEKAALDRTFDKILSFVEGNRFIGRYYKLINYAELFDRSLDAKYRVCIKSLLKSLTEEKQCIQEENKNDKLKQQYNRTKSNSYAYKQTIFNSNGCR